LTLPDRNGTLAGQTMKATGAAVSVGLAAWCSLGALGLADHGAGLSRVALLPPWWALPIFLVVSIAATRLARPSSRQLDALLGSTLALVPFLPVPLPPAALLWTGPFVVSVWIAVFLGAVAARERSEPGVWITDARRAPIAAAALALVLYGASAWWLAPILPDGDAPHYLIMTQSLLRDGDLKIENNHFRGDDLEYTLFAAQPDYLERGRNGAIYSIHAPGLSILIAPAFFLFGYPGAVAFLGLVGALGTSIVWYLGLRTTDSPAAAWFGWACCALTTPFVFQATQVFPDGLAASLVLLGVLPTIASDFKDGTHKDSAGSGLRANMLWLIAGVSLAILPWLQTRLALVAASGGLCVCLRARHVRQVALFALIPLLSAMAWFGFFYEIYGTPNPAAPYGALTQTSIGRLAVGFPGLLFDQQFGLVPNSPVYGVLLAGVLAGALRFRRWCWEALVIATPYLVGVGMFQIWFGGASSPARLVAPIAMLLGVAAARIFHTTKTSSGRSLELLALGVSVVIAAALAVDRGRLLFNVRDGVALWLEWSNDLIDLPRALPSLFRDTPGQAWLKAGIWAACFAGAWLAQTALERRGPANAGSADRWYLSWRSLWFLGTAAMLALTLAWQVDRVSPITAATGELGLLRSASRLRPLAFDYGEKRVDWSSALLSQIRIRTDRQRRSVPAGTLLSAREVPAGTYQVLAEGAAHGGGTLVMRSGSTSLAAWTAPVPNAEVAPVASSIRLPVAVGSLTAEGADLSAGTIPSVELKLAGAGRFTFVRPVMRGIAHSAVSYGSTRAFFMDDFAYAETSGFWVAGKRRAQVVLSTDSTSERRRLYVRNIPFENHLRISIAGERHDISLNSREETEIELPPAALDIVLGVETDAGIRPSQMDPGNVDFRFLGCWVEIR
jgi:hypothetical protein